MEATGNHHHVPALPVGATDAPTTAVPAHGSRPSPPPNATAAHREHTVGPASGYAPTAGGAAAASTGHINAAIFHDVTYPTARAAAVAQEAMDAAQLYYNLFFQANEGASRADFATAASGQTSHADAAALRGGHAMDGHRCHHAPSHRRTSHDARGHTDAHRSHRRAAKRGMLVPTAVPAPTLHRAHPPPPPPHGDGSGDDVLRIPHSDESDSDGAAAAMSPASTCSPRSSSGSSRGSDSARRIASHAVSMSTASHSRDTLAASCSVDLSSMTVQTPVNVVNTAYHTFFPPVLSRRAREAIVQHIVGHRPRPYRRWAWHKAEDYHELHVINVHHNNVYQQPAKADGDAAGLAPPSALGKAPAAGDGGPLSRPPDAPASLAPLPSGSVVRGDAALQTPLSTAPSYASSSPVARVAGHHVAAADPNAAAPSHTTLPHCASTGSVEGADGDESAARHLPHVSSFMTKDMPFELMSQLSMYTIPASQQGPEYFKKTAEDGTKTLIIFMMGLPARGKTFLAQKICRLLGWHGTRAKVQNIQVAWRRVLLDWEAAHPELAAAAAAAGQRGRAAVGPAHDGDDVVEILSSGEEQERESEGGSVAATGRQCTQLPPPSPSPPLFAAGADAASPLAASAGSATHSSTGKPDATRSAFARGNRLAGVHSTLDDVTRVVRDIATEALSASSPRRGGAGTAGAGAGAALPLAFPVPPSASASAAASTSVPTSAAPYDRRASPVCPSMQPYTAVSVEGSPMGPESPCGDAVFVAGDGIDNAAAAASASEGGRSSGGRGAATAAAASMVASAGTAPHAGSGTDEPPLPAEVLRTRHFRDLIEQPTSVARRLYRYVLQSFADDCRLFFQHGGEVVVVNDDFITEELRQEAETLFRPLAAQFFYMEVIRDAREDPLDFVQCKIRDPMEYPRGDIDPKSAADDFYERLAFLESVYETLGEAPKATPTTTAASAAAAAAAVSASVSSPMQNGYGGVARAAGVQPPPQQRSAAQACEDEGAALPPSHAHRHHEPHPPAHQRPRHRGPSPPQRPSCSAGAPLPQRSYVKIMNSNTIETHGISGYLASRIISYVMNLSQVKIQHPIYFVRHGESCYNLEDRIGGNPLLTEQGMRDAAALLEFLSSLKRHLERVDRTQRGHATSMADLAAAAAAAAAAAPTTPSAANTADTLEMWTSQLRRAIQTAELSERLLNIRTLRWSSLNEIHAGVCEDMTYAEVKERYPLIDYFRKRSKYTFRYPEGESYQDLVVRLEPVIMELENADKVVVVVAHQAVLRCLLAYFGSTSAESSISVEVPHRTVWRCTYDSKGIASLDELKLDNFEAGFRLHKSSAGAGASPPPTSQPQPQPQSSAVGTVPVKTPPPMAAAAAATTAGM